MEDQSMEINQELLEIAMGIIVDAGDARTHIAEGFSAIAKGEFEICETQIQEAKNLLAAAHNRQTEVIQNECGGKATQHSLIFIHAQDTLMTINSELNVCRQILEINREQNKRFEKIEESLRFLMESKGV